MNASDFMHKFWADQRKQALNVQLRSGSNFVEYDRDAWLFTQRWARANCAVWSSAEQLAAHACLTPVDSLRLLAVSLLADNEALRERLTELAAAVPPIVLRASNGHGLDRHKMPKESFSQSATTQGPKEREANP